MQNFGALSICAKQTRTPEIVADFHSEGGVVQEAGKKQLFLPHLSGCREGQVLKRGFLQRIVQPALEMILNALKLMMTNLHVYCV